MQVVTKAIITLLVAFSCWSSVSAGNLADTVKSCGDGIQLPFEIFVDGCDQNPCTVRNGTLVHFEMSFVAERSSQTLTAQVSLMLGSLAIPFTLPDEDKNACTGLIDTECPIEEGQVLRYQLGMAVETPIIGVSVELQFALVDDDGKKAVCYQYSQTITA